jgi:histidine triad (HIT) family protein
MRRVSDVAKKCSAYYRARTRSKVAQVPMTDCIFCRIVAGDLPSSLVLRDERCIAFMDLQPVNAGHVLVVPLSHAAHLADLEPATAGYLMVVAQRIAAALRASPLQCEGVNLLLADGEAAGQEVFHVHVHVVPRYAGDGFGFRFGPGYANLPAREQLDQAAAQLRTVLASAVSSAG